MWKQTWVKAVVICLVVNMVVFLPEYFTMIYSEDLTIFQRWDNLILLAQPIILGGCGWWLGKNELQKENSKVAHYNRTILQFISRYGLVVLLLAGLLVVGTDSNWPFYSWNRRVWLAEANHFALVGRYGLWDSFLIRCLTLGSLFHYWIMYVFYGLSKSHSRIKTKYALKQQPNHIGKISDLK